MPIQSSPALEPAEKETSINLLGGEKLLTLMSYHPTAIRGFLRQPEFTPTVAFIERTGEREIVVGVAGTLPLACLHIGAARKRDVLSAAFARRSRPGFPRECAPETQSGEINPDWGHEACSAQAPGHGEDSSSTDCVGE